MPHQRRDAASSDTPLYRPHSQPRASARPLLAARLHVGRWRHGADTISSNWRCRRVARSTALRRYPGADYWFSKTGKHRLLGVAVGSMHCTETAARISAAAAGCGAEQVMDVGPRGGAARWPEWTAAGQLNTDGCPKRRIERRQNAAEIL